jgi:hypothetical protein
MIVIEPEALGEAGLDWDDVASFDLVDDDEAPLPAFF